MFDIEYERFLEVFNALINHPYAEMVHDFIFSWRTVLLNNVKEKIYTPVIQEDGSLLVTVPRFGDSDYL